MNDPKKKVYPQQSALQTAAVKPAQPTTPTVQMPDPSKITQNYYQNPSNETNYEQNRPVYKPSQAVQDAGNAYQQQQANKPADYQNAYTGQIQGLIDSILGRKPFSYDPSADPLWQIYKDQYQRNGQLALKESIAQSAQMTGGYDNTYAQQAGNQAYLRYMEGLNGMIPQLWDAAYRVYQDDGDAMRGNLGMLQAQEQQDYGRWRDRLGDWQAEGDRIYNIYNDMSNREYDRFQQGQGAWEADRGYYHQKAQEALDQKRWEAEFYQKYGGGGRRGGGGGGRGGSRKSGDNFRYPETYKEFTAMAGNQHSGIMTEREYRRTGGREGSYQDYLKRMWHKYK